MIEEYFFRLDLFVAKKFGISREKAKNYIIENKVFVNNKKILKPSYQVSLTDKVFIMLNEINFVSRGGFKLFKAIKEFDIDIKNKICMDIGASTGGFSDCLLKNGALKVYAIDVGTNQLDESLKENNKIINIENMNIKNMDISIINETIDIITIDVSFISLTKIFDNLLNFANENTNIICLIKPQFEIGYENIKNGIVKDKKIHLRIIKNLIKFFQSKNIYVNDFTFSPIKGQKGNIEYLILLSLKENKKIFFVDEVVKEAFNIL